MAAGSGYDGSIRINTMVNTTQLNKSVTAMGTSLKKLTRLMGAAFSVTALVKFGKEAVELASDLQEVDNVVSKSFGDMRGEMDALASSAIKSLGMSRLTAYKTGSTFMSMGKSMLDSAEDAKNMALELTKLTGNMSSFFNVSQDLASIALKSIYTGETETLKQYGVVMTEVNLKQFALEKGITKAYSAMTQSEKVMLRYQYVMNQLNYIGDDFIDTQDSWANQTRILKEQWKEFMSIIGSGLMTVLTPVVKVLNQIVSALINLATALGNILSKLGFQMKTTNQSTGAYEDLAGAVSDYGDASSEAGDQAEESAKKANGALASFDDLNVLQQDSGSGKGSGTGGGAGIEIPDVSTEIQQTEEISLPWLDKLLDKFKELAELFKKGFFKGFGDDLKERIQGILKSIKGIKDAILGIVTDPQVLAAAERLLNSLVYNLGRIVGAIASIGTSIAQNLLGGIEKYLTQNSERIKKFLISMFDVYSDILEIFGNLFEAVANIFTAFGGENGQQLTANLIGIFADAYMGITELTTKEFRDFLNLITQPIIDNQDELRTALDGLLGTFSILTDGVKQVVDNVVDTLNSVYDTYISPFIKSVANGISQLVNTILNVWNTNVQPFLNYIATSLSNLFTQHINPLFTSIMTVIGKLFGYIQVAWQQILVPIVNWIIENVVPIILSIVIPLIEYLWDIIVTGIEIVSDILTIFFDMIGEVIDGITEYLNGLIEFITGVFTGDWELAWKGLSDIMQGASDVFKGIINGIIAYIEKMVNSIIDGINAAIDKIKPLVDAASGVLEALSGGRISFSLNHMEHVQLPRLANGGITTGATLAQIGEAGREAVIPLENNMEYLDQFASKLASKINQNGNNQPVYLQVDGRTFARLMNPYTEAENKRIGVSFT